MRDNGSNMVMSPKLSHQWSRAVGFNRLRGDLLKKYDDVLLKLTSSKELYDGTLEDYFSPDVLEVLLSPPKQITWEEAMKLHEEGQDDMISDCIIVPNDKLDRNRPMSYDHFEPISEERAKEARKELKKNLGK